MSNPLPLKLVLEDEDGPPLVYDVLDLHDLALLLNYERYAREPRFRRSMLVDVVRGNEDFVLYPETFRLSNWVDCGTKAERTGFMFKIEDLPFDEDQPDLPTPSDMLPINLVVPRIRTLGPRELETIFYQSRAHDSCFGTIDLLQFLFEQYDEPQPIRVRTDSGTEFITDIECHRTATFTLHNLKGVTVSIVLRGNPTYQSESSGLKRTVLNYSRYTTGDAESMKHCAMVFFASQDGLLCRGPVPQGGVVLDLASMQFGEAGRGLRGRSLFVLEPMENYKARMLTVAGTADGPVIAGRLPEDAKTMWLKDVARRAKQRYDRREKEHWCGHCGAPARRFACMCQETWYCDATHQKAAWPFHKHYCSAKTRK